MARIIQDDQGGSSSAEGHLTVIQADGQTQIQLPDADFMAKGEILRDGQDLILESSDGTSVVIENYFSAMPAPLLTTPHGSQMTADMVESFVKTAGPVQYAANATESDASAVGIIKEVSGDATITRADGSSEKVTLGMAVNQGDIVETNAEGAVNIVFVDESSFSISNNARLAIDEYVFDPATQAGETNVSILRGMFVFTSGLIGRDDPDDVKIETPVGSIGIRGTTIAGNIQPDGESQITVVEGAIVITNGTGEVTLSQQYETVTFGGYDSPIQVTGTLDAGQMKDSYGMLGTVNAGFFNTMNPEPASEDQNDAAPANTAPDTNAPATPGDESSVKAEQPVVATYDIFSDPQSVNFDAAVVSPAVLKQAEIIKDYAETLKEATGLSSERIAKLVASAQSEPTAVPALDFRITPINVDDGAKAGQIVGTAFTTWPFQEALISVLNMPGNNVTGRYFSLEQVSPSLYNIVLTEAGQKAIYGRDWNDELGQIKLKITLPGGRSDIANVAVQYGDFDPAKDQILNADRHLNDFITDTNPNNYVAGAASSTGTPPTQLGYAAAFLGDYDHNGTPDFAVATSKPTGSQVFVPTNANTILSGIPTSGTENFSLAGGGDVNGDGKMDIALGLPEYVGSGKFILFNGDDATHLVHEARSGGESFGSSLAMVDFNGDGLSDVFIGAENGGGAGSHGEVIRYSTTVTSTATLGVVNSTFSGVFTEHFIDGVAPAGIPQGALGFTMTGLTDFNNDGYGDFAVGGISGANTGYVDIYLGNKEGTASTPIHISNIAVDNMEMPLFDLGDINGDGSSDLMIGATGFNGSKGAAYIYFGDTDTNPSVPGDATRDLTIISSTSDGIIGAGSAGDFNGDGYADIFIATRTGNMVNAYVIYGDQGLSGTIDLDPSSGPAWIAAHKEKGFLMTLDLNLNGLNPLDGEFSMISTAIGDQNGDGFGDILLTSPEINAGAGGYFIVNGRVENSDLLNLAGVGPQIHAVGINTPTGSLEAHASSAGDGVIGNAVANLLADTGYANVSFSAGNGDDSLYMQNGYANSIDGGSGIDSVYMKAGILDFTNLSKLSGIEHFVFNEGINQEMKIGLNDIFSLLQSSELYSGTAGSDIHKLVFDSSSTGIKTLVIDTNGKGAGSLDGATTSTSLQSDLGLTHNSALSNGDYNVYTHGSGYQVYIDTDIAVTAVA